MNKLYCIKKFIFAENSREAIRKEKKQHVDEVWVDEDWKKENLAKSPKIEGLKP